jgi:hypothetical protein
MTITALSNQSPGAPSLTGVAGSLNTVLAYCLETVLGWTKATAGNVTAYTQPAGSNGFSLRVSDAGSGAANYARVRAYESISDLSTPTGVNPTPTDALVSGGGYWMKSATADATARPWAFYSDGKLFYLVVGANGTTPSTWSTSTYVYVFGDARSLKAGDAFCTALGCDTAAASTNQLSVLSGSYSTTVAGHYLMRAYTETGTSIAVSKYADHAGMAGLLVLGAGNLAYPAPISGGIEMSQLFLGETGGRRARLPGLWCSHHAASALNTLDTFSGATGTDLEGRSFVYYRGASGAFVFETSDTWST